VLERPVGGDDALIAFDGTPVGYVRWQLAPRSELEAAGIAEVPDGAIDIDIAIGEEAFVGRGIGPAALLFGPAALLYWRVRGAGGGLSCRLSLTCPVAYDRSWARRLTPACSGLATLAADARR
jgi:hypothetical protein